MSIFLTATLPQNFAYIMTRFNATLSVDTASDWDGQGELRMSNHIPGQPIGVTETQQVDMSLFTSGAGVASRSCNPNSVNAVRAFAGPFWPVSSSQASFRFHMANIAAAVGAAGFLNSHCEFLEYDLTQAQRFWINSPMPILLR